MRKARSGPTGPATLAGALRLGAAAVGTVFVGFVLRGRALRWGATSDELGMVLPGDEFLSDVSFSATRAVTIRANADQVWPWIAQLGQGRGGFYSYDRLENLVGCKIHSADRIVPEWQQIEVGDHVNLYPQTGLAVAYMDPGSAMVLHGGLPLGDKQAPFDFSWAFVLRAGPSGTTRLIVRERYVYTSWRGPLIVEPTAVISFVMSRRMLHGIRTRAQRVPGSLPGRGQPTVAVAGQPGVDASIGP